MDASRRVQAVASIYRDVYGPSGQIDVAQHLQQLCEVAEQSCAAAKCKIRLSVPSNRIVWTLDRVMPVSLIANELMTNAFRHGLAQGPGTIAVSLRRLNGNFELCVSDTGGRLPADFDLTRHAGFGLSIVEGLARQIGGSVHLPGGEHAGFAITFPA
jgi:two-component sensor histidine kinase